MKRRFLRTGEFARLCRTTKETLFHYDRKGLLRPRHVSDNGYRCYGVEQFFEFDLIRLLKETGSPLDEIRQQRQARDPKAWIELLRARADLLRRERVRLEQREAMIRELASLTESALSAPFDRLVIAERPASWARLVAVDPESMAGAASAAEIYAACIDSQITRGGLAISPLGCVIPEAHARRGQARYCFLFFSASQAEAGDPGVRALPGGRHAVMLHRGDQASQTLAFQRLIASLAETGLRPVGDAYAFDQMGYLLDDASEVCTTQFVVRVA